MKYCTQCGTQLEDNALFCSACGARQVNNNGQYDADFQRDINFQQDTNAQDNINFQQDTNSQNDSDFQNNSDVKDAFYTTDIHSKSRKKSKNQSKKENKNTAKWNEEADNNDIPYSFADQEPISHATDRGRSESTDKGRTNSSKNKKSKKSRMPMVIGVGVIIVLALVAAVLFMKYKDKSAKQEHSIASYNNQINDLYLKEQQNYLPEILADGKGEGYHSEAAKISDSDAKKEQKITQLKSVYNDFVDYDNGVIQTQNTQLQQEYSSITYKKAYLLTGEADTITKNQQEYQTQIEAGNFAAAKAALDQYKQIAANINDDSLTGKDYDTADYVQLGQYMSDTIQFTVYNADFNALTADHILVYEKVGDSKKKKLNLSITNQEISGANCTYTLTFQPNDSSNYKSKRKYTMHVRSNDGTKGFTTKDDYTPASRVEKDVDAYVAGYVKAFSSDCYNKDYNQVGNYLESGSTTANEVRQQINKENIFNETNTSYDVTSFTMNNDGTCTVKATEYYDIDRIRTYKEIKENDAEKKFFEKNMSVYIDDTGTWIWEGDQPYPLRDNSTFEVVENIKQYAVYTIRVGENSLGTVSKMDATSGGVQQVKSMGMFFD